MHLQIISTVPLRGGGLVVQLTRVDEPLQQKLEFPALSQVVLAQVPVTPVKVTVNPLALPPLPTQHLEAVELKLPLGALLQHSADDVQNPC